MKKLPQTATLNGRKYRIEVTGKLDGCCDQYGGYTLLIAADLNTRKGLITAIHEALHACNWTAKEDTVDKVSTDIGRLLWNLGYRHGQS